MLALLSRRKATTAHINLRPVTVNPKETLLQAALREGIPFPNSCRVGGCATCKCKLVRGKVKELTESGYILSDEEVREGYILACQSVPQTDVSIDVELLRPASHRKTSGRVIGQEKLTHDITRLRVQLDAPLQYRAGQFADIGIASLPGISRSYSFAAPTRSDGQVSFFVRKVAGGEFSSLINDSKVIGQSVLLDGPSGDFWLRPGEAPLLLVAGGSGLAPVLALLQEAAANGVSRSVILLFGAREEKDLYALEEINRIASQWRGTFRFVPVLSDTPAESTWAGERGLVVDKIPELLEAGSHAYLCGPPPMIDRGIALLEEHGIAREHIHADRFLTRHDAPAAVAKVAKASSARVLQHASTSAGVLHYLKYFLFHAIGLIALAATLAGGSFITAGLAAILAIYLLGDAVLGDDTSTPQFRHPGILTAQLWLALPLLALIVFAAVWHVSPGDPFGFGNWIAHLTGYDVIAARDATSFGAHVSLTFLTGLMIGMVGTIPAHELTHRTWDPVSMLIGRCLLAFSFDTVFSIEHVYGHHRYVSTEEDPATAPRGRNVYHHVVASTVKGNISAWNIEQKRLARKGLRLFSWRNAVIRGHLMSLLLVVAAWAAGGWQAAVYFTLFGLWGKSLLEIVNYMEHYGMVRNPQVPVQPRHSWNTNKRISSWTMFNLTRHSHHHAQGEVPYQDLKPFPDAPIMIGGYLTTIVVAMIPPLWHKLMTPKVLAWDRDFANAEERQLVARANARSDIPAFQRVIK
ncbi:fatty acid desaturase [Noviherbaspirillum saxi]|uniref:Flavodoxin reductase n=1 Tax=Noviherbaspirillum saxi TaxID=2320863 RepID=A0A3A3FKP0_9BURK|nr:fatty acid desaturase [Noviherbaspirillum saxi]RJF91905.1 flavodoxin reductase [Noviherbaspirillum saxi]